MAELNWARDAPGEDPVSRERRSLRAGANTSYPITALTLARSPARISIAGPSPISAATALSRFSADDVVVIGLGRETFFLRIAGLNFI
jgi:hypothetical protein